MNARNLIALATLSLAVVLVLMTFGGTKTKAALAICSVPSISYPTIQSAANDSTCSTINVAVGTYNEQVQITRTLTLNGAQAGVDARTRVPTSESIINHPCGPVQIMADNVVVDGFTVQGATLSDPCFIAGIWTNPGFSGTQGGHQILNNIVQNNITGIELDNTGTLQTKVQFNLIQNNNNPGPGSGNGIQVNFGLNNALLDNNKFSGHTNASVLVSSGGDDQKITVSNNELVGGSSERIVFGSVADSAINGNTSIGSTAVNGTIRLFGGNSNITINSNVLRNGVRGIRVDDPFAIGPNSSITAHMNCIAGNVVAGLEASAGGYTGTLNAENNWWGSATGPTIASNPGGTGDAIIDPSGVVDYTPFLSSTASTPCAPPPVGPPTNKDQCKDGGWQTFNTPRTFKNQGDCIQYVNTGK